MDYKRYNYLLIILILLLCLVFIKMCSRDEHFGNLDDRVTDAYKQQIENIPKSIEKFNDTPESKTNYFKHMQESLTEQEKLCAQLDRKQKENDEREILDLQKQKLHELEIQDNKIQELKEIYENLKYEKLKKDKIVTKCKSDTQQRINDDYSVVHNMAQRDMLQDESVNVSIDLNEFADKYELNDTETLVTTPESKKKGCTSYNLLKKGTCQGCNADSLAKNMDFINKDFR